MREQERAVHSPFHFQAASQPVPFFGQTWGGPDVPISTRPATANVHAATPTLFGPSYPPNAQSASGGGVFGKQILQPFGLPAGIMYNRDGPVDAVVKQVFGGQSVFAPDKTAIRLPPPTAKASPAPASPGLLRTALGVSTNTGLSAKSPSPMVAPKGAIAASTLRGSFPTLDSCPHLVFGHPVTILPGATTKEGFKQVDNNWLKGPASEIVVGSEFGPSPLTTTHATWSLSNALISRYSLTLREACSKPQPNERELRIALPEDDPKIFELFVEFMYSGSYQLRQDVPMVAEIDPGVDVQAWALGDRLGSIQFKNYVMGRLYTSINCQTPRPVTPEDVEYACLNSPVNSKLRTLLFDHVSAHFSSSSRVAGTTDAWDKLSLSHADVRSCSVVGFRTNLSQRIVKVKELYMETEEDQYATRDSTKNQLGTVLGKRDAGSKPVKTEKIEI